MSPNTIKVQRVYRIANRGARTSRLVQVIDSYEKGGIIKIGYVKFREVDGLTLATVPGPLQGLSAEAFAQASDVGWNLPHRGSL